LKSRKIIKKKIKKHRFM